MTVAGQGGEGCGGGSRPTGGLPQALFGVLAAPSNFARNFARMQAKRGGFPLLWRPGNPRWWWQALAFPVVLSGPLLALRFAVGPASGSTAFFFLLLLGPAVAAVAGMFGLMKALQRKERLFRAGARTKCFAGALPPPDQGIQESTLAAVRYAIARVGGFAEEAVRPDERAATFMRITLIRCPLLHEFSYYVSERLPAVDPGK